MWEIGKLVLLGVQDPRSPFSALKDVGLIKHFLIHDFSPVMKSSNHPDFPGFSGVNESIFTTVKEAYDELNNWIPFGYYKYDLPKNLCLYFLPLDRIELDPLIPGPCVRRIINVYNSGGSYLFTNYPKIFYSPYVQQCSFQITEKQLVKKTGNEVGWDPTPDFRDSLTMLVPFEDQDLDFPPVHLSGTMSLFPDGAKFSWSSGTMKFGVFCHGYREDFALKKLSPGIWTGTITSADDHLAPIGTEYLVTVEIVPVPLAYQDIHDWILGLTRPTCQPDPYGPIPLEDGSSKKLQSKKVSNAKHDFKAIKLSRPRYCEHCGHLIKSWGLTQHYECKSCSMTIHNKCIGNVLSTCYPKETEVTGVV